MSLGTLLKVQKLQAALHAKAKGSPSVGWANWRKGSEVSPAYRAGDRYTADRLRQWSRKTHQVQGREQHATRTHPCTAAEADSARRVHA